MHHLPALIYDLAIMLCTASLATLLFRKIGQPVVLGYLLVGVIIGPYTPPHAFVYDIPNIRTLSELGVIFLIFSLGLEFSFQKLTRVGFSACIIGILEVILMMILGFILAKTLGWSFCDALFFGAAISISSTTIIIKVIDELNLMKKSFSEILFGVLVVEDVLAILLLVILSTVIVTHGVFPLDIIWITGKLVLVISGWFIAGYLLIPVLQKIISAKASEETVIIVVAGLCLFLVSLAAYLQYSIALGAFIMGSILAETNEIRRIKILIKPLRDIFAAVFFISIGMLMDPKIVLEQWPIILLITSITILGKIIVTGLSALLAGQNLNTSIKMGLSMGQVGEFSFIIIGLGVSLKVVDEALFPIVVATSVIAIFITPYLIRSSEKLAKLLDHRISGNIRLSLDKYTVTVHEKLSMFSEQYYKRMLSALIVNGIIIAIMFTLSHHFLLPWVKDFFEDFWWAKTFCWFIAFLLSLPFFWGMIFSSTLCQHTHIKVNYRTLRFLSTSTLALLEILFLSFIYFHTWPVIFYLTLITITFFIGTHQYLKIIYFWFEKHLMVNLRKNSEVPPKYEELGPWDSYLAEVNVGSQVPFFGKTIAENQIRQQFGINIVLIQHRQNIIFAPTGNNVISPYDKLVILGEEEQIEEFRKTFEKIDIQQDSLKLLENVILKKLLIEKNMQYSGKTIRESKIREKIRGMVVGFERKGMRILNPDPDIKLKVGDVLYLTGEIQYLEMTDDK